MEITKFVVSGRNQAKLEGNSATYRKLLSNRILSLRRRLGIETKPRAKYTPKAPVTAEDIGRNQEYVGAVSFQCIC
jgi:signal recognition particle subunit SRP68